MLIAELWRAFGAYFEFEEARRAWCVRGSREGIASFCAAVRSAAVNTQLGPHRDLLLFAGEPRIMTEGIRGSAADFARLADLIEKKLDRCEPGDEFQIDKQFAAMNSASVYILVEDDDFDPASPEPL